MDTNTDCFFIQVNVCSKTERTSLDSASQKIPPLHLVALVFVTTETPFVKRLNPVQLLCLTNAPFTLQMESVVRFSNASIAVSKDLECLPKTCNAESISEFLLV